MSEELLPEIDIDELIKEINSKDLILYNDDVNTFQHVYMCLRNICKHSPLQAEQCVMITHNNGKCSVKKGSTDELVPMHEALVLEGLTANIE